VRVEPEEPTVFIRDALKNYIGFIRPQCFLSIPCVIKVVISVLNVNTETTFLVLRLLVATATFLTFADLDGVGEGLNFAESHLAIFDSQEHFSVFLLFQIVILLLRLIIGCSCHVRNFAHQNLRAIEADALQDFDKVPKHSCMVHWAVQGNVAKMTGTSLHT